MGASAGDAWVRAWKPPVPGVREVLHASFPNHAYPPHTHDVWTLFVVDDGLISYDLDRHARGAEPSMVSLLPPHVVHDGRPGGPDGYRKRVVYLESDVVGDALIGPVVDRSVIADPTLRGEVARLHDALGCIDDAFHAEIQLAFVVERIKAAYGAVDAVDAVDAVAPPARPDLADAFRAYLDRHAFESVTVAVAAVRLEASPTQLARTFAAAFEITPHAYLMGRRLEAARERILGGQPLASVAADVGFADQAHMTRRFKRFLGVTPGRFAAG